MSFVDFKMWLVENTVSQFLHTYKDQKLVQTISRELKKIDWLKNIDPFLQNIIQKWFVYQVVKQEKPGIPIVPIISSMKNALNQNRDYTSYLLYKRPNEAKSKFNNPKFDTTTLKAESDDWHKRLAKRGVRKPGMVGRVIKLANMPAGYFWVSLDKFHCDMEAKTMGHCGNSAGKPGDIIYSLRDAENIPHLTFIINNGILGESKGYGNSKPTAQYHPMIAALLMGKDKGRNIVNFIAGGGHEAENNFKFTDLSPELQQMVLKVRPGIVNLKVFLKGRSKKYALKMISNLCGAEFKDIIGNKIIIETWENIHQMVQWLNENTASRIWIPDFEQPIDISYRDALEAFETWTDDDIKEKIQDPEEEPDLILHAVEHGLEVGMYKEVHRQLTNYFQKQDTGFDVMEEEGKWIMYITFDRAAEIAGNPADDIDMLSVIGFNFKVTDVDDFDGKAYNDYLRWELGGEK